LLERLVEFDGVELPRDVRVAGLEGFPSEAGGLLGCFRSGFDLIVAAEDAADGPVNPEAEGFQTAAAWRAKVFHERAA
jgi:hypothetical protein